MAPVNVQGLNIVGRSIDRYHLYRVKSPVSIQGLNIRGMSIDRYQLYKDKVSN